MSYLSGVDTKGERISIDEDNGIQSPVVGEDTTLDSGAVGSGFIRVNSLRGLLSKVSLGVAEPWGYGWNRRREQPKECLSQIHNKRQLKKHLVNVLFLATGILENLLDGFMVSLNKSMLSSPDFALVKVSEKLLPFSKDSMSILVDY